MRKSYKVGYLLPILFAFYFIQRPRQFNKGRAYDVVFWVMHLEGCQGLTRKPLKPLPRAPAW